MRHDGLTSEETTREVFPRWTAFWNLSLSSDLCQDFGHASSRNQAAIGMTSGLGSVLSKKAAMASAGTL